MNLESQTIQAQHGTTSCDTQAMIQEIATRRYLGDGGAWTTDFEKATAFRSISAAMEHVRQLKLVMVQLVSKQNVKVCEVIQATRIGVDGWSNWLKRLP